MVMLYPSLWWALVAADELLIPFSEDPLGNLGDVDHSQPDSGHGSWLPPPCGMTRTMMLEALRQDYVRTAWAKGLRERIVIIRHSIKNALIPVVSRSAGLIGRAAAAQPLCGLQLPILVGGSVIMEVIFNLPGLGQSHGGRPSNNRDYPVVSGVNLFFATGVVLLNLLIDLIYPYLDPRVRYE